MKAYRYLTLCVVVIVLGLISGCSESAAKKQVATTSESAAPEKAAPTPKPVEPVIAAPPERVASVKPAAKPAAPKQISRAPSPAPRTTAPVPSQPTALPGPPEPVEAPPTQVARNVPIELPPPPPPDEPVIRRVTLPSGTLINVRMIDSINSDSDHVGQSFKASMASPVLVNDEVVIPKNADVYVKLVEVRSAGNMSGTSQVKLQLDRIFVGAKSYVVDSNTYVQSAASQTTKTVKTVGISTAIGAGLGAILGGKKGAAVGAGVGAGSGAAVEAATKGEQVRIASESALTFRLEGPIEVVIPHK